MWSRKSILSPPRAISVLSSAQFHIPLAGHEDTRGFQDSVNNHQTLHIGLLMVGRRLGTYDRGLRPSENRSLTSAMEVWCQIHVIPISLTLNPKVIPKCT